MPSLYKLVLTLQYYRVGCPFNLHSNYALLQCLNCMKDTNTWIIHWHQELQPFKFEVVHKGGTDGGGRSVESSVSCGWRGGRLKQQVMRDVSPVCLITSSLFMCLFVWRERERDKQHRAMSVC